MRGTRHGVLITCGPEGTKEEDTFVCGHCCRIVTMDPGPFTGDRCTCCDRLICKHCVGKGCDPIEKKMDRMESRARLLEAMRVA